MTVDDLIEMLQELPPHMPVMVRGVAGGFEEINYVDEMTLVMDYHLDGDGMGNHEDYDLVDALNPDALAEHSTQECVVLK